MLDPAFRDLSFPRLGSARGFSPASLFGASDVGFFWDFTTAANLSQDNLGATPVTAVTQTIGRCADLSGKGNHLTQSTAGARPIWGRAPAGGVRNRLSASSGLMTIIGGGSVVDAGAHALTGGRWSLFTGGAASNRLVSNAVTVANGQTVTGSVFVDPSVTSVGKFHLTLGLSGSQRARVVINVNGTDVTFGASAFDATHWTSPTFNAVPQSDGSVRLDISTTNVFGSDLSTSLTFWQISADTPQVKAASPQIEIGATATAYQRVTTVNDVTEAGVADRTFAVFDGTDDSMSSASFDWLTDKATVVAVVRKQSDAATGVVASLSANLSTQDGSWALYTPSAALSGSSAGAKGVGVAAGTASATGLVAPASSVMTMLADIAGDSIIHRRDGVGVATLATDRGTGNFGNYQVYVGARAGVAQFLNGRIAALIGINRILTAAELSAIEAWGTARLPT